MSKEAGTEGEHSQLWLDAFEVDLTQLFHHLPRYHVVVCLPHPLPKCNSRMALVSWVSLMRCTRFHTLVWWDSFILSSTRHSSSFLSSSSGGSLRSLI